MAESNLQNRRLGYARVSTYGGAQPTRRELLRMLKALAPAMW